MPYLEKQREYLLYLIFSFLAIPFNKEDYDQFKKLKKSYDDSKSDKKDKLFATLVENFNKYIKEKDIKNDDCSSNDYITYIIIFAKRCFADNDYYVYGYIKNGLIK